MKPHSRMAGGNGLPLKDGCVWPKRNLQGRLPANTWWLHDLCLVWPGGLQLIERTALVQRPRRPKKKPQASEEGLGLIGG
jgi:hypothetical protein